MVKKMARKTKRVINHDDMREGADKIKSLLVAGADVNTRFEEGVTPLMSASVDGSLATVDVLLKAGADLELQQYDEEMTALMKAAMWNNAKVAAKLLSFGAQVNKITKHGCTALMYAALAGAADTARVLLQCGADAKLKDQWGRTALDYAQNGGHAKTVALLTW